MCNFLKILIEIISPKKIDKSNKQNNVNVKVNGDKNKIKIK